MTCKELAELMMAYCDGELSADCCEIICEHIRMCGPCLNYMESYRITVKLCRDLPAAAVPQHLLDRVRAALKEDGRGSCGQ
jgi:anti-sigma factor RsiW